MKNLIITFLFLLMAGVVFAQSDKKDQQIIEDAAEAKAAFLEDDPSMSQFFNSAYGYIILPNVGKGGLGVGGAAGNGVAIEQGTQIGFARMTQVTIGFEAGGKWVCLKRKKLGNGLKMGKLKWLPKYLLWRLHQALPLMLNMWMV